MKKQAQSARGRYVSAEKVQELFAQLGIELCAGRKRIRAKYNQQLSAVEKEKKWDKILNIRYWYLVFYIY